MNLTRERIRQVEVKALAKLEALKDMMALRDYVDEGPVGKRRLPRLSKADLDGDQFRAADKPRAPIEIEIDIEEEEEEVELDRPIDLDLLEA